MVKGVLVKGVGYIVKGVLVGSSWMYGQRSTSGKELDAR